MGCSLRQILASICVLAFAVFTSSALAQSAGQNINMVSGTDWTTGDPFLQRQNEPSIAVSTRNPAHLLGAANDYRSVDLPGLLGIEERGDAWLGIFKSFDGGQSWASTLLPGYPQDTSPDGTTNGTIVNPLHGFQAGADPAVRAANNGLFYVSGIVFNRGTNAASAVFVTRYIDNNNRENGDPTAKSTITNVTPTDSIRYLGSKVVASGTSSAFVDKPWLAVDIPRGTTTCAIPFTNPDGTKGTETIPAGNVYMTYTTLNGTTASTINFIRSTDCGVTWSKPIVLSQYGSLNQGTVIAVSPVVSTTSSSTTYSSTSTGTLYVAWRRFANANYSDAIMIARSSNGGQYFDEIEPAVVFPKSCATTPTSPGCLFDQGLSAANPYGTTFRTNAYPALTVDGTGRVFLAWTQRQLTHDARIMMTVSSNGDYWTTPAVAIDNGTLFDDFGNPLTGASARGHQFMPSLAFNAGKLMLAYYDLRQDHTRGIFTPFPDFSNFNELRSALGDDPSVVFTDFVDEATLTVRRHTVDLEGAQASPPTPGLLLVPTFTTFRISRYQFGQITDPNPAEQLEFNAPNVPIFVQGTQPFMGDYIDVAGAPQFVLQNGKWQFNTAPVSNPIFHTAWTDNRDVRPPLDGNWQNYTPPFSASNSSSPHTSVFDGSSTVPGCVDGTHAGMRNQNVYTSRISTGLIANTPANSKLLGVLPSATDGTTLFRRAFTINVQNTTGSTRTLLFSTSQPANAQAPPFTPPPNTTPCSTNPSLTIDPRAILASMLQFCYSPTLTGITIAPHDSVSRPVFLQSTDPAASITVTIGEAAPDPLNPGQFLNQFLAGGFSTFVTINPDRTTPSLIDPAGLTAGVPSVSAFEVYNPAIGNPAIGNPAIGNPAIGNPAIGNPAIGNPAIGNPAIGNLSPTGNPAIGNNDVANPAIGNPAIGNPAIGNPAIGNTPMTDASYTVENVGNTSSSYAVKLFGNQPPNINLQLIITKNYITPTQDATNGCNLTNQATTQVVANVLNPDFATPNDVGDPLLTNGKVSNATVSLAPGETAQVTIRAFTADGTAIPPDVMNSLVLGNVTPVVVAHPVNTADAANGIATPPSTLVITTTGTLPDGLVNQSYLSNGLPVTIATLGGTATKTFTLLSGSLPAGLTFDPSTGAITGSPTVTGTFTFTIQVADSSSTVRRTFTLNIVQPLKISAITLPDGVVGVPYPQTTLSFTGGTGNVVWTTSPTDTLNNLGLTLNATTGVITGTPTTATAGATFAVTAMDSGTPAQTVTVNLTIRIATLLVTTTNNNGRLPDAIANIPYAQSVTTAVNISGGITPYTYTTSAGSLPAGLSLTTAGLLSGTAIGTGASSFAVTIADSAKPPQTAASVPLTISVVNVLDVLTNSLPDGIVNVTYPTTPLLVGGGTAPFTWSITSGALPAGLTFTNGVISGKPTIATSATGVSITFSVKDSGFPAQTATKTLTVRVGTPLAIATTTLPAATYGVFYSQTLTATGGLGTYTWTVASGTLPAGISLSSAGLLSGTPTSAGTFSFTAKVVDSSFPQQSKTQLLSLTVTAKYKLTFYVQPSNSSPGSQITPSVKVLVTDSTGKAVKNVVVNMLLSINPGNSVLTGATSTTGNNGIAIFASQSLNNSGNGYQLEATAPALLGAQPAFSVLFNVR